VNDDDDSNQPAMAADWAAALQQQAERAAAEEQAERETTPAPSIPSAASLEVILDIPVRLSLEVGNTDISIRQLLKLSRGSVVELDRLAGEPLDVLVNGTLIAHGEVVVTNDKFGLRLTDVLSPSERIRQLR
jgi:flagellar motor switch protein FliN/FliY